MSEKQRILLVDDDPNISHLVRLYLEKEGFEVTESARGDDALVTFQQSVPDLVLLDVMLPGMDGLQVLREIRKTSKAPVIMLTARDETFDKVLGLELGADDYITKPFETKELVARVKAVLRRAPSTESEKPADKDDTLRFPQLTISLARYEVTYEGRELEMPPKELEVLYYLASHPNMVLPASSCWSAYGALISLATAARWTYTSSVCAKNCLSAKSTAGKSTPYGAWATSSNTRQTEPERKAPCFKTCLTGFWRCSWLLFCWSHLLAARFRWFRSVLPWRTAGWKP